MIAEPPKSLYVHVPFCASRCAYCDFHSRAKSSIQPGVMEAAVDAVLADIDALLERFCPEGREFDTVYVGGGTPTALGSGLLAKLLRGIGRRIAPPGSRSPARGFEWTVEANPESLDSRTLEAIAASGATRLSLGLQSMDDDELRLLGRPCTAERNLRAVSLAGGSGLSLSADLITALPRRAGSARTGTAKPGSLADAALALAESGFGHLSVYDLVPEEGTRIGDLIDRGELLPADQDIEAERRALMEGALRSRGFGRYEISNYALPGAESLHNGAYWAMRSYIGAGEGAVSTLRLPGTGGASLRIEMARTPARPPAETIVGPMDSAFEMVMMGFRTSRGLDLADFATRFGVGAEELLADSLAKWSAHVVRDREGFLALDGGGMDLLNAFLVECLGEIEIGFVRRKNRTSK